MKHIFFTWMCILFSIVVKAQNGGDIDPTFQIGKSFSKSGNINAIAAQSDGKIIVGGTFNSYDKISANDIVRLNTDGTIDTTFNPGTGFIGNVNSMAVQSDGKILVGGEYNSFNGNTANNIIRLNTNGTKDTTFNMGTGCDSYVYSIVIQPDGKILLGGFFSLYNEITANGIIRLNSDGTIDSTFTSATEPFTFVLTVTLQPDGKILVGDLGSIFRLNSNGTLDSTFTPGPAIIFPTAISLQSDGKIIVGEFNGAFRLNSDGTNDSTFNTGTGFNRSVSSVKIQTDGKILIGGAFTTYNGVSANRAVRLNPNGTVDQAFNFGSEEVGLDVYDSSSINSIVLSAGKILFAGSATLYKKESISGLIKVDSNGVKDGSFNIKDAVYEVYSASTNSIVEQSDGKIIVGGDFNYYFGTRSSGLVRLNIDGTRDNSFNTLTGLNNGYVNSIVIQPDGKILVAGFFSSFNGIIARNIIRLNTDGTIDTSFNTGTGFGWIVNGISLQPDGKIFAAGQFNSYNDVFTGSIIRLNTNGSIDYSFNIMAFSEDIKTIALQADGKILTGGNFLVRLNTNGTIDNTFDTGDGFAIANHLGSIGSTVIQTDGKILVAGQFDNYNGTPIKAIVRLNSDATIDGAFIPDTDTTINCIAIQPNGKILIGINSQLNNITTNNIIRLNPGGTVDTSFDGLFFENAIKRIMVQKDGKIIAGGGFSKYDGKTAMGIVRLLGDSVLSNENFSQSKLSVYPNPAQYRINIQSPSDMEIDQIIVTDMAGKMILKQVQSKEIDIENLRAGIYIIQAYSGQSKWQSKFVKE